MKCEFQELYLIPSRNGLSKPSKIRGSGFKMINMGELFANDFIYDIPMERVPLSDSEKNTAKVETGDLLFARQSLVESGAGKCSIVVETSDLTVFESHIIRVRLDTKKANPYYFYYYFRSPISPIKQIVQTGVQSGIKASDLAKLMVECPRIEVQNRIVSILQSIDRKIRTNQQINDNLQQQAYAYFIQTFVENADPSWRVGTLSDLGTIVGGGTPSKAKPEYYTENGIAWITPKDLSVDKSKFISHGDNDISELGYRNSSATMMPSGTVLFSSRAPIGYIAIAKNDLTTNQGFKSVVPKPEIGTPYVYFFLLHNLPLIESKASGSTFKEVSGSVMKSVEAVIPDSHTISKFNDFCFPIFEMQEKVEQENRNLAALRDSLLPNLMSGEIDLSGVQI